MSHCSGKAPPVSKDQRLATIVLMGVSGSGRTTVGRALAGRLGCTFVDGDDYHPAGNVAKMARGKSLTDEDREPWLDALATRVVELAAAREWAVVACSALKELYRARLRRANGAIQFVFLRVDRAIVLAWLLCRSAHFAGPALARSQFETLESPDNSDALVIDASGTVDDILATILKRIAGSSLP